MIIVGAGGHAKEVLGIVRSQYKNIDIFFYDDVTKNLPSLFLNEFVILRNEVEVREVFKKNSDFVLGIGGSTHRYKLGERFMKWGGELKSVICSSASIGHYNMKLGEGLNIMMGAVVTEAVTIGKGSLIHVQSSIHHDCQIGEYCEILPGSHLLGNVKIGNCTSIGSGAIVLPKISIGSGVVVGAGAVVTKNVGDGVTVKGIPAR